MIRKIRKSDINTIAKLHKNELPGFLARLDHSFLKAFYSASLNVSEITIFVVEKKRKVVGFALFATSTQGLYKKIIFQDIIGFVLLFMKNLLKHPSLLIDIFKLLTYPGFHSEGAELLLIAVRASHQKKGIGRQLVEQIVTLCHKQKINVFRVSVYKRLPATAFYRKIGCQFEQSFSFFGEPMQYYKCIVK